MSILKLPSELLLMIGDACESHSDLSALSRTNSFMYELLNRHIDKEDDLVRGLVEVSNTIRGFSWTKFCSIWYDGIAIRGTVRFLIAREQNLDIHAPGPFNGQEILKSIVEEADAVGIDMLMEWKGDELLAEPAASQLPFVYYAASLGQTRVIRRLLRNGFPIDFRGEQGRTPLMIAAANGHVMAVKMLLERGASVALTDRNHRLTALGWALRRGTTVGSIRLLSIHGSDPNVRDKHNRHLILTPLYLAFTSAIMPLLWGGASFSNDELHIPHFLFDFACQYGLDDVVRWVYRRWPELVRTDGGSLPWYFLLHAVHGLSVRVVRQLLEWGADPNLGGPWDESPLNSALKYEDIRAVLIVKDLLNHGANANVIDKLGTPLQFALRFEKERAVVFCRLLLAFGLDLRQHRRAIVAELLHLAVDANDLDMVRQVDEQGVSMNLASGNHKLPIIQAMSHGYVPIVNYLLYRGGRHDVANRHGQTVLTWAIANGHVETVRTLLHLINLKERRDEIETALVMGLLRGDDRVNQVIVDAGLDLPGDFVGIQHLFGSA
ncbi:ankyrin repeat-containing domain protein [Aspergillus floccosus]